MRNLKSIELQLIEPMQQMTQILVVTVPAGEMADFLNAVYFRRGLTCTLGLTK